MVRKSVAQLYEPIKRLLGKKACIVLLRNEWYNRTRAQLQLMRLLVLYRNQEIVWPLRNFGLFLALIDAYKISIQLLHLPMAAFGAICGHHDIRFLLLVDHALDRSVDHLLGHLASLLLLKSGENVLNKDRLGCAL